MLENFIKNFWKYLYRFKWPNVMPFLVEIWCPKIEILRKLKIKSIERQKWEVLQNSYLRFSNQMFFYKKINKTGIFIRHFTKSKIFITKTWVCCRTMLGHLACQISGWYIYFWQTYSPKIISVGDVIFLIAILINSRHHTEIKMTFLEMENRDFKQILSK